MKSRKHLAMVAALPCCICGTEPVQCHHIRGYPFSGAGQKASDLATIPLCPSCHAGYHAEPKTWEMRNGAQVSHLMATWQRLLHG